MKKIFFLIVFCVGSICFADEIQDVQNFFDDYIAAANSYSPNYFSYYTDNAKITRIVEKPDGSCETVNIPIDKYKQEAKKSLKLMKLSRYKNKYFNVKITPHGKDYKIAAMRMPSTSDYKVPAYFIIGKDSNGDYKIKEESMNTKVQSFLKS